LLPDVEQSGHLHSPRIFCCQASGSSGKRIAPMNSLKSDGVRLAGAPLMRAMRNSSSCFFYTDEDVFKIVS
jgi:hypothetical protein